MLKAREYGIDYNFINGKPMDIKMGFRTYRDAEKWSFQNTIDGKVIAYYDDEDEEEWYDEWDDDEDEEDEY